MVTRSQPAVMVFNAGCDLEQAKIMEGKERFDFSFSKVTQVWLAKPIKENNDDAHLFCLMDRTMEVIKVKAELELPDLPKTLRKNIAPISKPEKEEIIEKQISRCKTK